MDNLYLFGAYTIKYLQDQLPYSEKFFIRVSELTDPAYAFLVIFPVTCVISTSLGAEVLAVSVMAEWTNTLLKWLLMEDRPYWWTQEADDRPGLKQTKLTCETGPGSPSGHCTGATVMCYVIVQWMCKQINEETLIGRVYKRRLNKIFWILFTVILFNVILSRMYHATHFPHQCLLGIINGFIVNYLFSNNFNKITMWWKNMNRGPLVLASTGLGLISLGAYWFQKLIGIDPQWSVKLAFKWCVNPDYVHVNTTPMYSLVRDIGAAFGIAMSSPISKRTRCPYHKGVSAVLTLIVCSALQLASKEVPTVDYKIYYLCMFMLNAMQPYFMLVVIPFASYSITKWKRD